MRRPVEHGVGHGWFDEEQHHVVGERGPGEQSEADDVDGGGDGSEPAGGVRLAEMERDQRRRSEARDSESDDKTGRGKSPGECLNRAGCPQGTGRRGFRRSLRNASAFRVCDPWWWLSYPVMPVIPRARVTISRGCGTVGAERTGSSTGDAVDGADWDVPVTPDLPMPAPWLALSHLSSGASSFPLRIARSYGEKPEILGSGLWNRRILICRRRSRRPPRRPSPESAHAYPRTCR